MSVERNGRYVLVRHLGPSNVRLNGLYDVMLIGGEKGGALNKNLHEVVESGKDSSAAEWSRLFGLKEDLQRTSEVMES